MAALDHLFANNKVWAARQTEQDPEFFVNLSKQQSPDYLWIGCSDSRVPANVIIDLAPGEVFVHRNIANLAVHTDLNFLSVLQYSVEMLQVNHIIVCGHYGCGGVKASLGNEHLGLIDNWLRQLKDTYAKHEKSLRYLDEDEKLNRMCEFNVIEQVLNVCHTGIVQSAWARGQDLTVHGWIYGLDSGQLKDLRTGISCRDEIDKIYQLAIEDAES